MAIITAVTAEIREVPLRYTFATSRDVQKTQSARQVSRPVIVTLRLADGRLVQGESVPVQYVTGETQETVQAAVEQATPLLLGGDVRRLRPLLNALQDALPTQPSARAGLEMALFNGFAAVCGIPLASLWGGALTSVTTDITLSIVPDVVERAVEAAEKGFRLFKVKVGSGDHETDFQRLAAVHDAVPGATFRIDANQAFTPAEAIAFIERIQAAGIPLELVEQPTPYDDLAALDAVARAVSVPVFADETVKSPADALRLVRETSVEGINIKLMKAGVAGALDIIAIARTAGRRLMIGCMLETRLGIAVSLALACGTGAFDHIDLDSHLLLNETGDNPYFTQQGAAMHLPEDGV